MSEYILPLEKLIEQFARLPGIGKKTAVRLAFSIVDGEEKRAEDFAEALLAAKRDIKQCPVCFNLSEGGECAVCADSHRDRSVICVVEDVRALMSIERVREYKGLYHVLGGVISPMDGIGPEQLRIAELVRRLEDESVKEIIIATNPTVEGETTALYLSRLIKPLGIKISRLAYGMPAGGELEYTDEVTLFRALQGRRDMD
ncbi:MAG: recombination protein RecR [Ruminococcaceae bacterium]|nr:recombination protein RecR [Oscillospiraceae bacterium]